MWLVLAAGWVFLKMQPKHKINVYVLRSLKILSVQIEIVVVFILVLFLCQVLVLVQVLVVGVGGACGQVCGWGDGWVAGLGGLVDGCGLVHGWVGMG